MVGYEGCGGGGDCYRGLEKGGLRWLCGVGYGLVVAIKMIISIYMAATDR